MKNEYIYNYSVVFDGANSRVIGSCDTKDECYTIINKFLDDHEYKAPYWRMWVNADNNLVVDVGSHTEFFIIVSNKGEEMEKINTTELSDMKAKQSVLADSSLYIKTRGFEVVRDEFRKTTGEIKLPTRATSNSAGYDFYLPTDVTIPANSTSGIIATDVKAYMRPGEVLLLYVRSSVGIKKGLVLANGTGVIDADYYSNVDNDGNIGLALRNETDHDIKLNKGERIMQGIFVPYLVADNGNTGATRTGGVGSTNK